MCSVLHKSSDHLLGSGVQLPRQANPYAADLCGTFYEPTHTYTVDGVQAERSTTGLVDELFEGFDAVDVLAKYYEKWKAVEDPRYYPIIRSYSCADGSVDDGAAKSAIAAMWHETGLLAASIGTELHLHLECLLNQVPAVPTQGIGVEVSQFYAFQASTFYNEHELVPHRSELMVWFKTRDVLVAAGRIDALFSGRDGFYIFDWKRVAPKKDVSQCALPFQGRTGRNLAREVPDTPHHRYSLQTSIYAEMLTFSHRIDVAGRMYLVRMHSALPTYELVCCTNYRDLARRVLQEEHARLVGSTDSLRESLLNTTEVGAAGTSLTHVPRIDYDAVKTLPATLSGLTSVIQPRLVRDLTGVYEVHSVAVMGVSAVLESGGFSMMCCAMCKTQVDASTGQCHNPEHSSADAEPRWILQLDLADYTGGAKVMLYHDAAETLPFLHGDGDDSPNKLRITRAFRSTPWSIRMIYKRDDRKLTNNLDLKRIVPTISVEGFVASFRLLPTPIVPRNDACPFAACKSVSYDRDLGALFVSNLHVQAVRLLIEVQPVPEDETIAEPDESQNGFRVTRRVKCEIDSEDSETYIVKAAGTSAHVQWLMTAQDNAVFLVTARKGGEDEAFNILSHLDTKTIGKSAFAQLMKKHMNHVGDVAVTHAATDTPCKRLGTLQDAVPLASTPRPFNKRRKLDEIGSFT